MLNQGKEIIAGAFLNGTDIPPRVMGQLTIAIVSNGKDKQEGQISSLANRSPSVDMHEVAEIAYSVWETKGRPLQGEDGRQQDWIAAQAISTDYHLRQRGLSAAGFNLDPVGDVLE